MTIKEYEAEIDRLAQEEQRLNSIIDDQQEVILVQEKEITIYKETFKNFHKVLDNLNISGY